MKKINIILISLLAVIAVLIVVIVLQHKGEPIKLFDPTFNLEQINKAQEERDSAIAYSKKLELKLITIQQDKENVKIKYYPVYVYIDSTRDVNVLDSIIRANW